MVDSEARMREVPPDSWPAVDADQMRNVDDRMENEFGIELMRMMENAGRSLAWLGLHRYSPRRVLVLAGAGGNGGGGLAAARHLANRGVEVEVVLVVPAERLNPVPRRQFQTLQTMDVYVAEASKGVSLNNSLDTDLVIDAMVGYSLSGNPRSSLAGWIDEVNEAVAPVLSLDVPTGFDADSGVLRQPHIQADATLALAAPKFGLLGCGAAGEAYVADISVPLSVYSELGARDPAGLFGGAWVVRLTP